MCTVHHPFFQQLNNMNETQTPVLCLPVGDNVDETHIETMPLKKRTTRRREPSEMNDKSEEGRTRDSAMEKRNARQEASAKKAMKQFGKSVTINGLGPGAVITLKVDYRTHSHAYGLMAIVYKALETGGILVCCEHGVVTSSGTRGDFWVPGDKYKVIAGADAEAAISDQLEAVRMEIKNNTYNYKSQKRISYAKYHEIVMAGASPMKRGCCKCKKGCKAKSCSCRKKQMTCHSGCACNGNCDANV